MSAFPGRQLALGAALILAGCAPARPPIAPSALVLAENAGSTLVVVTLDPAGVGTNSLRVDLQSETGGEVRGSVDVRLERDGRQVATLGLAPPILPVGSPTLDGAVTIPEAGRYTLHIDLTAGAPRGSVAFDLDLPSPPAPPDLLARVDAAMNALRFLRERQTLASGVGQYVFSYEYASPGHIHYIFVAPDGTEHETILLDDYRYDRDVPLPWSSEDLGSPTPWPDFTFSRNAQHAHLIAHESVDGVAADVVAFTIPRNPTLHYRLWVGANDLRARRYVMMATGHYMRGTYSDFDAPVDIRPP